MRVWIASTSTNNVFTVIGSLQYALDPLLPAGQPLESLSVFHYDQKQNMAMAQACQGNPENQRLAQAGMLRFPKERVGMDRELLASAEAFRPDLIVYIGAWEGPNWLPSDDTLKALRGLCPTVHLLFDAADPPWQTGDADHGNIHRYEDKGCFDVTVCLDGAIHWPGSPDWPGKKVNGLSLLTPVDPRLFKGPPESPPFAERPYSVAYAGNAGGYTRGWILQRLQHAMPIAVKLRDDNPHSYKGYADFLKFSRVVVNVPFTGSGASKHVKGRVVEAGYAGCCLLEWKNPATAHWFQPRHDYWEYNSVEECIEMAQFLSAHSALAGEMAAALHERVTKEHAPEIFWAKVFNAVGISNRASDAVREAAE